MSEEEFKVCRHKGCPLELDHKASHATYSQTKDAIWVYQDGKAMYHMDLKPGKKLKRIEIAAMIAYMDVLSERRKTSHQDR